MHFYFGCLLDRLYVLKKHIISPTVSIAAAPLSPSGRMLHFSVCLFKGPPPEKLSLL